MDDLFHVAADYRLWMRQAPEAMYAVNVDATVALFREAVRQGLERIVYTSSVATLALRADGTPSDESMVARIEDMLGHYKRSKFMAEAAVRRMAEEGAPIVIVNPSTPVGPRDVKPTPTGRLVIEAARRRLPGFVDTGLNVVHVDDVAAGHLLAHERGRVGERYVLGGENLSLESILDTVGEIAGTGRPWMKLSVGAVLPFAYASELVARLVSGWEPFVTVEGVKLARKRMFFSSSKAERELGYVSRPAHLALSDAVSWYREHGYLRH
jgi:dihydroflavonol-4-reductase